VQNSGALFKRFPEQALGWRQSLPHRRAVQREPSGSRGGRGGLETRRVNRVVIIKPAGDLFRRAGFRFEGGDAINNASLYDDC
jgi:hypothetical protein